jgi:hypothetical protein
LKIVGIEQSTIERGCPAVSSVAGLKLQIPGGVDAPVVLGGSPKSGLDGYVGGWCVRVIRWPWLCKMITKGHLDEIQPSTPAPGPARMDQGRKAQICNCRIRKRIFNARGASGPDLVCSDNSVFQESRTRAGRAGINPHSDWRIRYPAGQGLTPKIRELLVRHEQHIWNVYRVDRTHPDFERDPVPTPIATHEAAFRVLRDLKQGPGFFQS